MISRLALILPASSTCPAHIHLYLYPLIKEEVLISFLKSCLHSTIYLTHPGSFIQHLITSLPHHLATSPPHHLTTSPPHHVITSSSSSLHLSIITLPPQLLLIILTTNIGMGTRDGWIDVSTSHDGSLVKRVIEKGLGGRIPLNAHVIGIGLILCVSIVLFYLFYLLFIIRFPSLYNY